MCIKTSTWLISSSGTTDAGTRGRVPTMTPDLRPLLLTCTVRCIVRYPWELLLREAVAVVPETTVLQRLR